MSVLARATPVLSKPRVPVVIGDNVRIPDWIVDLDSFRRWAVSDDLPKQGWFSYLGGEIWVDLSMEQLFVHNRVKTRFTAVLSNLSESSDLGYFFSDRVLLSNPKADLSTKPDGLFCFYETVRSGRVRLVEGKEQGFVEVEGTPDMVLEIISPSTVHKDKVRLRELYDRAGVPEYWLVDALGKTPHFDVLRRSARGYTASRRQDGWVKSALFSKAFRLTQKNDRLGHLQFTLEVRG